ncbi:MAG: glycosyltransferase [Thermoplasmata archaeon]
MVGIFNDAFRNELWISYLMSVRMGAARTINVLHGFVDWANPLYAGMMPLARRMVFGSLNVSMFEWMRRLGLKVFYTPNGTYFPKEGLINASPSRCLIFVGRIDSVKSPHVAIELAKQTGIPLKIVGPASDLEYFRLRVKPELGEAIQYLGEVGDSELQALLLSSLALVYIGTYNDPQPGVVLEAIAHGVPVVGLLPGPYSGFHDAIQDGKNGLAAKSVLELSRRIDLVEHMDRLTIYKDARELWSWDSVARRFYVPTLAQIASGSNLRAPAIG